MSVLQVRGLVKSFGNVVAVRDFALDVQAGSFVSLLGPSGCGKSTILRMIAGLIEPDAGSISIGNRDVTWAPPHRREIGLVFQSYALFPHMNVFENVAFGLRERRLEGAKIKARVAESLELVRLGDLGHRMPRELSGGQQQRVALARAIAIRPALLLLDEPLSNLDAKLRDAMRIELRRLQQELSITTLFVTHDQEEALTMSDRICVLDAGVLQQVGTPREVYDEPANAFVAEFFGRSNILEGQITSAEDGLIALEGFAIRAAHLPDGLRAGAPVRVTLRQEAIAVSPTPLANLDNVFAGRLELVSFAGSAVQFVVCLDSGVELIAEMPAERGVDMPRPGQRLHVGWQARDVIVRARR